MKFKPLLLLLVLLLTTSVYLAMVSAAEDGVEDTQETEPQNNTKPAPKISSGKRSEVKTLEEFIPSEEISADKPISFPTDI